MKARHIAPGTKAPGTKAPGIKTPGIKAPGFTALGLAALSLALPANAQGTRFLRQPSIGNENIVFSYANDIWIVGRDGGDALRLTSFQGSELNPHLSPDGKWVTFSGQYDGNTDVYVLSVDGGEPRRMTWHPSPDVPIGWSPDGSQIIFNSVRDSAPNPTARFWTIELDGSMPESMVIPRGRNGHYSPDMKHFAYQMVTPWETEWRNYRGGQNNPIWVLDMESHELSKLPWDNSNDTDPVWLGDTIYFLSDRDFAKNIWSFDTGDRNLEQVTRYVDFDVKNLEAGGGSLIYEYEGYIHTFDPRSKRSRQVVVDVKGDLHWTRPYWKSVGNRLANGSLSPTGKRAVFEARGEIFTVPSDKGDWRNLTRNSGSAERAPAWSPDGQSIAWFSDASGEYQLMIGSQDGIEPPRVIELEDPTFYSDPAWSPDSKYLLFTDEGHNIWYIDVESEEATLVDTDLNAAPPRPMNPTWSPDSNWIAYNRRLDSDYKAIMVYSLEQNTSHQLTDGMSDAIAPAWDADGKYLYFLASTNFALNTGWLDMSNYGHTIQRAVYFAVLQDDVPSPLMPESDEEPVTEDEESDEEASSQPEDEDDDEADETDEEQAEADTEEEDSEESDEDAIRIDWDGIDQRILSLGLSSRNYIDLFTGKEGIVFYAEAIDNQPGFTLHRYDLSKRESKPFMSGISSATISHDGNKLLYQGGGSWGIASTSGTAKIGDGRLDTDGLRMKIEPRREWKQIYREAWRYQRDYFYVPNMHGTDWQGVYEKYLPWVEHVSHRTDLNQLLDMVGAELCAGHNFVGGGDNPSVPRVSIGLLGVDIETDSGRYRIAHILTGENWNPNLVSPLRQPGLDIDEGDYIVAVNGVELTDEVNFYSAFEATAGRQTVLKVSDTPDLDDTRDVTVVPVGNDAQLRQRAWIEDNRRKVAEMSGGRLAYVWLPNTGEGGYTNFNRYYFAQQDKQGAVIDERFNGGGSAADYIVELMARKPQGFFNNPVGDRKPFFSPGAGIWGPKVMIINENAGSGGDYMPYLFRSMGVGPLIGTRTWGGLIGHWDYPRLIDGGVITIPRGGFYNLDGEWDVENIGVAPDIHVEMIPKEVIAGHDPQLERAVEECLRLLEEGDWPTLVPEPAPPMRNWRPER